MAEKKKTIVLFDQDLQPYRLGVYRFFAQEFGKMGYELMVLYDAKLNKKEISDPNFLAWDYSFSGFRNALKKYDPEVIIQFVWLRYKFLFPFMLYARLLRKKLIVWSHGINLQKRDQKVMNKLYELRQRLANALIIYHSDQLQFIVKDPKTVFVANNTLNFYEFPKISLSKQELKLKYELKEKQVILCVGRMDMNNRKVEHIAELATTLKPNQQIVLIGPGVDKALVAHERISYLGPIYDQQIVNEYYRLADVYIMPGAIGLAINQAFYHSVPVVIENVDQGPEGGYLKVGENGFLYEKGNANDLNEKVQLLLSDQKMHEQFSVAAKNTMDNEGAIESMFSGFKNAVEYVQN
ncbi:MAG: glycosyltransferase family 4 protein [Flavobacteriales bacterium]|nr:glycosyltransferase family 4 protein [Flavobacteriales bacterium]